MPTYEYECAKCKHSFEVFQNINDKPITSCPKCGKGVKRLIGGGAGVIFKGSGFYVNDYKKSNKSAGKDSAACPNAKPSCGTCPNAGS